MDTTKLELILHNEHEGYRQFVYKDSLGYVTVGIGRCIDPRKGKGISLEESLYLLRNDIAEYQKELEKFTWYEKQDDVRKCALIELSFNMGLRNLLTFKKALAAMDRKDYTDAAVNFLDSKWRNQVGDNRARDIAYRIEHGKYR